ncbi:MAG TPA: ABC transporter ATP-binding protein [Streptosporangiales bacterium]
MKSTADAADGQGPAARPPDEPLLSAAGIRTCFRTELGEVTAVDGVSFDLFPGETVAIVGESGSGKSVTVMSLMGLVAKPAGRVVAGSVKFGGRDLLRLSEKQLRRIRGRDIAMVFQDPMSSLNPVLTVGYQTQEALRLHDRSLSAKQARARAVELLTDVGIPSPEKSFNAYPHEYSGGMRQRVLIAMAMANDPQVFIADEPTTALDVTIQAQVLRVLKHAQKRTGAATILVTHDLGLVAEMADRVLVMYAGRVIESGDVDTIFYRPKHPYTVGLLASRPRLDREVQELRVIKGQPPNLLALPSGCSFRPRCAFHGDRAICAEKVPGLQQLGDGHTSACHFAAELPDRVDVAEQVATSEAEDELSDAVVADADTTAKRWSPQGRQEVLRLENLQKAFPVRGGIGRRDRRLMHAVNGVSLILHQGETLGLVGETGCGKSTIGRMVMRILDPTEGTIAFKGRDITRERMQSMPELRRRLQIVFQDPYGSLDPRMRVRDIVGEPLQINQIGDRASRRERVLELLELVGLGPEHLNRYPHQFSGGQRQRVGIARALAMDPEVLVLDEPVSALDVSLQAQIINLLNALKEKLDISYVFISHDLSVVRYLCDTVAVVYSGQVMESGTVAEIFDHPVHPYTQTLLSSVPIPDPALRGRRERIVLEGDVQSPLDLPEGCLFQRRCFKATERCRVERPVLTEARSGGHLSACHYPEERDVLSTAPAAPESVNDTGTGPASTASTTPTEETAT